MSRPTFLRFVSIAAALGSSFLACSEDAQNPNGHQQSNESTDGERSEGDDSTEVEAPVGSGTSKQTPKDKDVMINPGDTITSECTFAQPMAWGEGTGQEMCLLFVHAYPKGVLVDYGPWGTFAHGDNACLGQ